MPTAQELELAVQYALGTPAAGDDAAAALRQQATRFCDEVKASADGWAVALQLFGSTSHAEARFFALLVFQDALGPRPGVACRLTNPDDRARIRDTLMAWLSDTNLVLADYEKYLRTKIGVVLALLVRADYPDRWPTGFSQLTALLQRGPAYIDLYFRFLTGVDDEIVNFNVHRSPAEAERNTQVKDAMRRAGVVVDVCSIIHTTVVTYQAEREELAAAALDALQKFVGWIDIGLVVNDKMLPLLYQCLGQAERSPDLAKSAADCLEQVVSKVCAVFMFTLL
jgi:exportin-T